MMRGNGGQDIFYSEQDRYRIYLLLQEGISRFNYRVHAFCLMKNHVHLAIQVADIPLSKIVQNLSFRYTRWVNKRLGRTGHLFQGRYKAILVDQDSYLLQLVRYIHLNPLRVGLTKDPSEYLFSSHRCYCGLEILPWLTTDWILGQFGNNLKQARQQYVEFILDGIALGCQKEFHQGESDARVLGDDNFLEKVLHQPLTIKHGLPTLQSVVKTISKTYGCTIQELKAPGRNRRMAEARHLVGLVSIHLGIVSLTTVASFFGRDVATLSTGIKRLTIKIRGEAEGCLHCRPILDLFNVKL
ncbi:MAG: transposase [Desulfocapsa sp.]|nr:transposase [Desulfocapsa sp.]